MTPKESKLKQKLNLVSVGTTPKTQDKVEAISLNPAKGLKPKVNKAEECYIYLGRLKAFPKILITQLRFETFKTLEECEGWCKEHCSAYEIRSHKTNKTLIKI